MPNDPSGGTRGGAGTRTLGARLRGGGARAIVRGRLR